MKYWAKMHWKLFVSFVTVLVFAAAASALSISANLFTNFGYDYVPSQMIEGSSHLFWWCTGSGSGDRIAYREITAGAWSGIWIALEPTPGTWDSAHTCDPSVVKGNFYYNGSSYAYAMYYTATDDPTDGGHNNGVGVAYSNDRINWVKYPFSILRVSTTDYGIGQQSVISAEGGAAVWLWALHKIDGGPHIWKLYYSPDSRVLYEQLTVSNSGVIGGVILQADFAHDDNSGYLYMTSNRLNNTSTIDLYQIPWGSQGSGTWSYLGSITPGLTGQATNHGSGIRRNIFGRVTPWLPDIVVLFGAGSSSSDPFTWDLFWAKHP